MVVTSQPSTVDALYESAAGDFERYEVVKDLVDECIDLALNYRQSGHPGGSRSKVHMLLSLMLSGGDALGPAPAVAAVRRSVRAFGGPHGAAHLRHAGRAQRGVPRPLRARRRRALRVPGRRPVGAHVGAAPQAPAARRPARPRRDGGQDPLPEVQHRPVRPRHGARRRRGTRAEACRRGRDQGLRLRGRGRADAGRRPRGTPHGVGSRAQQPRFHDRLERLRHRRASACRPSSTARRRRGSTATAGA